jgi:hypothetical protein
VGRTTLVAILAVFACPRASRGDDKPASPTKDAQTIASAASCRATDTLEYNEWCDPDVLKKEYGASVGASDVIVCVQAADGCLLDIKNSIRAQAIPPNRAIVVAVHACGDSLTSVAIGLGGVAGQTVPGVYTAGLLKAKPPRPTCDSPRVYLSTFAPRTPGVAPLSVTTTVKTPAAAPPPPPPAPAPAPTVTSTTYGYELFIPQLYSGALRVGYGVGWVNHLGRNYSTRKIPGSDFADVVDNGGAPLAMDLVIGYAPFLFDRSNGGRYYGLSDAPYTRWAPYFALSALSANVSGKVDWLRSVYVGLEYELLPGSSLAVALSGRRVDALANGLYVGLPVADGTSLTKTTYQFGLGVVFNFTPFFFQFASSALPK